MDSGNSGSMQSSSGGDEEFDSRCSETPSFAAFFNNSSTSNIARISHQGQKPPTSTMPAFFDNFSSRFDAFSRPPQPPPQTNSNDPFFNLESMTWMTNTSTPHHCTDAPGSAPTSSFASTGRPDASQRLNPGAPFDQTVGGGSVVTPRGSKKRPRASRRAPTTVLTTDTSNFRQMVQEFTGIPSPPLSSPVFPRSRFDLFNNANVLRQSPGSKSLLRPYAQKLPMTMEDRILNPFVANINSSTAAATPTAAATSSNAPFDPSMTTTSTRPTSSSTTTPTVVAFGGGGDGSCSSGGANQNFTSNYQLPSDLGKLLESNPMFTFQSFLQTSNPLSRNNFTKLPLQSMSGHNQYPSSIQGETTCSVSHGFSNIFTSSPTADDMTLRADGVASAGDDLLGWEEEHHGRSLTGINGSETTGHDFVASQDHHEQQFDTDVGKVGW